VPGALLRLIGPVRLPAIGPVNPLVPVSQHIPGPKGGASVGSVPAPTYAKYREWLDYLALQVPGFRGSAEWSANFARGSGLDRQLYTLYKNCGNLGLTATGGGAGTPTDDNRYVLLTNYLPSLVLKSVAWVVGTTATVLWNSSALPPIAVPGKGPHRIPGPVTGSVISRGAPPTGGPVSSGPASQGPLRARI